MNISFLIVVVYLVLMFVMGFVLTRRSKNTSEMFVGNSSLNLILLVPLLFGEVIAASSTTGTAQGGYTQGISAIWVFVGKGLGSIVFAYVLVKFFNQAGKAGAMSVPEAFNWRFDGRLRVLMMLIFAIPVSMICASQVTALASLLGPMIGVDTGILIVVAGIVFALLALAGVRGIAKMNIINSFMIIFGIVLVAVICVMSVGGVTGMMERLPGGFDNLIYPNAGEIGGQFISALLAYCVTVSPANVCYSTGSVSVSRKAMVITGVMSMVFALFPTLIGMCGAIATPGVNPNTILYSMPASISPVLSGVACMAVMAAVISTAPFFYLSFSTVFVRDIVLPLRPATSEKGQMRIAVATILVFMVVVIWMALNTSSIFGQIVGANHIKACAGFLLLVALVSKRLSNNAAFWSLLISGGLSVYWHFSGSVFGLAVDPLWPALGLSVVLMVAISAFDWRRGRRDYEAFAKRRDEALAHAAEDAA